MDKKPAVLVTGASSGIGLATARLLAESGYRVYAGVRRHSEAVTENPKEVLLDVSDESSIRSAVAQIRADLGREGLAALINNAGIAEAGPIEFTSVDKFRQVFEVNVFGMVAVTQAFLPLLHQAKGRIVNIGSIGGLVSIPFGAALCASKHAVEAISDCMRLELHSSGIPVTCMQPASINSGSAEKLATQTEVTLAALSDEGRKRYEGRLRRFLSVTLQNETHGSAPIVVAEAVREVLQSRNPPSRRLVGKDHLLLKLIATAVPDGIRDRIFRKVFFGDSLFDFKPERDSRQGG